MAPTDWEHLPFGLIEELKAKNLYYFVVPEESSCNKITIEVYKNEKFRNLAGDWGSIVGVHIFPAVDRRPLTNEKGSKYIR
ncbi:hypothetical protein EON65_04495 [archaeon]|nr:MAG: hypothetical protein EON65_04495 [archaeon]